MIHRHSKYLLGRLTLNLRANIIGHEYVWGSLANCASPAAAPFFLLYLAFERSEPFVGSEGYGSGGGGKVGGGWNLPHFRGATI